MTIDQRALHSLQSGPDADGYKPFLAGLDTAATPQESDWTRSLDLAGATSFSRGVWGEDQLRVLVLYGSLRQT